MSSTFNRLQDDVTEGVGREAARSASSNLRAAGQETVALFTRSKLALNGLLLLAAGFFGVWGVLQLQLQAAIISSYVLFFGGMLIFFSVGMGNEATSRYFGFMYHPSGQLLFLVVAGNLAWTTGLLGIAAALFTNFHAANTWYLNQGHEVAGSAGAAPAWIRGIGTSMGFGGSGAAAGSAGGVQMSHLTAGGGGRYDEDEML